MVKENGWEVLDLGFIDHYWLQPNRFIPLLNPKSINPKLSTKLFKSSLEDSATDLLPLRSLIWLITLLKSPTHIHRSTEDFDIFLNSS